VVTATGCGLGYSGAWRRFAALLVTLAATLTAGCAVLAPPQSTGETAKKQQWMPVAGSQTRELRVFHGSPVLRKSLFWDGNGEDETAGIKGRQLWHLSNHIALGAGLGAVAFFQSGRDAFAGEFETVGRVYLHRAENLGVFTELTGGWMQSTHPVPTGGTEWNMSFSFTGGVEVPLENQLGMVAGLTYHHISNALGRQHDRNPSQNEAQFWLGLSWRL